VFDLLSKPSKGYVSTSPIYLGRHKRSMSLPKPKGQESDTALEKEAVVEKDFLQQDFSISTYTDVIVLYFTCS